MRKRIKNSWIFFSIILIVSLLLAHYARTINPADSDIWPMLSLGYPIILSLYVIMILFWFIAKGINGMIMLAVLILFTWSSFSDFAQVNLSSEIDGEYKLMSYNARLFGFYQFKRNTEVRDSIFNTIEEIDADIMCFQEFYHTENPKGFLTKPLLEKRLGSIFTHEKYTHEFVNKQYFGVVTLSRHPIIHKGYIPFEGDFNNFCIYTDIQMPKGDTLRVFNAHLASIHFRKEDYEIMDTELSDTETLSKKSNGILRKLMAANKRRAQQIEKIMKEVERTPYAIVFAGDFNDPPFSYTYYRTKSVLQDSFKDRGQGLGNTYNGPFPSFRIDHVLHSDNIEISSYEIDEMDHSDHFPIIIEFNINNE